MLNANALGEQNGPWMFSECRNIGISTPLTPARAKKENVDVEFHLLFRLMLGSEGISSVMELHCVVGVSSGAVYHNSFILLILQNF